MKIDVDGLTVYFPYPYIYPEQYAYMRELKRAVDAKGHAILEMPTGTGKTVTLLSFIMSYQLIRPEISKLVYCTRTVGEIGKVLEELDNVVKYRNQRLSEEENLDPAKWNFAIKLLAVGLTTRRNLCLHENVRSKEYREDADAECRRMTASWVRSKAEDETEMQVDKIGDRTELCSYYERFDEEGRNAVIPAGIYTLDHLMEFGKEKHWCPYYTARHALNYAHVVVYNYQYLLDPKIAGLISSQLARESIVVFDEAHNIDNVCIDALSVTIRQGTLSRALGNLTRLANRVAEVKDMDAERLRAEYQRLYQGISTRGFLPPALTDPNTPDQIASAPVIPADVLEETVPGSIRKAEHFIGFLRRVVDYLRGRMKGQQVRQESPPVFLQSMLRELMVDSKPLRFCSERLKSLILTLQIVDTAEFAPLVVISDFTTVIGTYGHLSSYKAGRSFAVIFEPYDERFPQIPDPILQLACLDASLAMRPVFARFQSVILTSGTISPLELYARILGFRPSVTRSFTMSLNRRCICPMVVARGADQVEISSRYERRSDQSVIRNYGALLIDFAGAVPDGIVVFFTSYIYMEQVIQEWNSMQVIERLLDKKLVFIETPDALEASLALENYRKACDSGRGAIFLCVARGKVAEGIDFDRHYGRCVIMMGIPYQYTESRVLRARLEYMREQLEVREGDYLSFDAMRQAAQCIGRVIRSKSDYGIMVMADRRYIRADKKNKLPPWILENLSDAQVDLDTDMAVAVAKSFLRQMAQPMPKDALLGTALLSEEQVAELTMTGTVKSAREFQFEDRS